MALSVLIKGENIQLMKILIFHGYLLRGTGSNIYNANLAIALAGLGHQVHLLCQDLGAETLDWVNSVATWPDAEGNEVGELRVESLREPAGEGSITVYRPPIGHLLPVYVEDPYEGFEARAFPRLSEEEVENYISVNVAAVRSVEDEIGGADAALAKEARKPRPETHHDDKSGSPPSPFDPQPQKPRRSSRNRAEAKQPPTTSKQGGAAKGPKGTKQSAFSTPPGGRVALPPLTQYQPRP